MEKSKIEYLQRRTNEILSSNRYEDGNILFHQPSPGTYGSFFGWDSGWSAISASNTDPETALRELQTIFHFQFDSGQISHEILLGTEDSSFGRKLFSNLFAGQFEEKGRSFFIDPPSFLLAAEVLYTRTKDKRVLELLPAMERCFNYLVEKRDLFGDGLASIIHPWESGCDFAPYFDEPMNVNVNRRFWGVKYLKIYLKMIRELRDIDWNLDVIKEERRFAMEDVGINGITAGGAVSISNLYKEAGNGEKAEEYLSKAKNLVSAIEKHLWVEEKGFFYPRVDIDNPRNVLRSTAIGISPLLSGLVDPDKANNVLENYLLSEKHFYGPYVVAFNSRSELEKRIGFKYMPMLWRGPCIWININWIAAKAADKYGRRDIAKRITKKTIELLEKSDFREYYHPEKGIGGGAKNFTWATLVLDMIKDYF